MLKGEQYETRGVVATAYARDGPDSFNKLLSNLLDAEGEQYQIRGVGATACARDGPDSFKKPLRSLLDAEGGAMRDEGGRRHHVRKGRTGFLQKATK